LTQVWTLYSIHRYQKNLLLILGYIPFDELTIFVTDRVSRGAVVFGMATLAEESHSSNISQPTNHPHQNFPKLSPPFPPIAS
jgi:hypothetical protein